MGTKKTSSQTSSQTQTAAPPSWTLPGLELAASKTISALNQSPGPKYTGDFLALPDMSASRQVQDSYRAAATQANELAGYVQQHLPTVGQPIAFGGPALPTGRYDVGTGTNLAPVIEASLRPAYTQLTEQLLPNIRSGAVESGAYSGNRALEILPGQALADWSRSAADTAARIGYEDYNAREARRLQAHGMDTEAALSGYRAATERGLGAEGLRLEALNQLPALTDTIMRMGTAGGDLIAQAEAQRQAAAQQVINNALARNQYETQYPWQGLDVASQILARLSGGYGTTTSNGQSTTVEKTGGLGAVAQGVLGAASLAAGLGAFGPLGAGSLGAGAAAGMANTFAPVTAGGVSQMFRPLTLR